MPPDKLEQDPLGFLSLLEREMIERLAQHTGRTPVEEVRYLIRRRVFGYLKDLGDDRGSFRLYEDDLPALVHAESVEIRK